MAEDGKGNGHRDVVTWAKDITVFLSAIVIVAAVWTTGRSVPSKQDVSLEIAGIKEAMERGLQASVKSAKEEVLNSFDDPRFPYNQAKAKIDARFEKLGDTVDNLLLTAERNTGALVSLTSTLKELTGRLETLREAQTGTHVKIDKNAEQIDQLTKDIQAITNAVARIEKINGIN